MKRLNIDSGAKYGRWTIIEESKQKSKKRRFLCLCDCGTKRVVYLNLLRSGHSQSCGCYNREVVKKIKTVHGDAGERLYEIWCGMKKRCNDPSSHAYHYYGGRGIKVCSEWVDNYPLFKKWALNNGYKEDLTLERKDNDDNYKPSNCEWIQLSRQNSNKRNSYLVKYKGQTKNLNDWAIDLGFNYQTLHGRLRRGWSVEYAFETPLGKRPKGRFKI